MALVIFWDIVKSDANLGISSSLTATNPTTSDPMRGTTYWFGRYKHQIAHDLTGCSDVSTEIVRPPLTDNPVIPYYPPSTILYGKENLDMPLVMVKEDDYVFDGTVMQDGDPVNLAGYTITMTAKYEFTDPEIEAVFQIDNSTLTGIVVTDATNGEARFTIASAKTASLASNNSDIHLVYDIQLTDAIGARKTIARGKLIVRPQVTRI